MTATDHGSNAGSIAVRPQHRFDEGALARWMTANVHGFSGPLTVSQFRGGQSSPTYELTTPSRSYVLRRKPPGPLLKGAHAIEREARVLTALAPSGFPIARVHALCTDETVIGTPFYVMDLVEGRIFWDATLPDVPRQDRSRYFDAMNATIAELHRLPVDELGLTDYGRSGGYVGRQVSRLSRQYQDDVGGGRNEDLDALVAWLPDNLPAVEATSIVHGDFRCDNLIFHAHKPIVVAVLDWELSTIGDPIADFAYHAMMYRMPPEIVAGLAGADLRQLAIPSEAEYLANYCARTGRRRLPDYDFYIAFNLFRLAAIFHGIKARVARGTASSEHARERAESLPRLARLARDAMEASIG